MKDVYTIEDLRNPGKALAALEKPARLAVIGDPVAHSKSPQLHQPALDTLYEQTGDPTYMCSYIRVHLSGEEFSEGVSLMQKLGFIGCNVTVPHKERALAWAENPDAFALQVGVANTLIFSEKACYTTDPVGLEKALEETLSYRYEGGRVFLTGAGGGAGSAVAQYMVTRGLDHAFLYNRTEEKLDEVYEKIISATVIDQTKISRYGADSYPASDEVELFINATSLGLRETDPSPLPEELLRPGHLVYDMTYGCENALSKACKKVGAHYADGLSMLRHQGAEAFILWFPEISDPIQVMGLK